jgi:hypothetical protein
MPETVKEPGLPEKVSRANKGAPGECVWTGPRIAQGAALALREAFSHQRMIRRRRIDGG